LSSNIIENLCVNNAMNQSQAADLYDEDIIEQNNVPDIFINICKKI